MGPPGPPGPPGDKYAIVPSSQGPVGLVCVESPEVWFEDVVRVSLDSLTPQYAAGRTAIDPLFVEVCVPQSLLVTSVVVDRPGAATACVDSGGMLRVRATVTAGQALPLNAVVVVRGIRAGREHVRFRQFNARQMDQNNAFWRSGYGD